MSKLRLIQAGVGGMGKTWWTSPVKNSPDFDCVAIVDIIDAELKEAGDGLGLPQAARFNSLEAALDSVGADAVLTVTPPPVHVQHAELAFARGLHLLCEKPIAHDLAAARRMVELAHRAGKQLLVAQNYRYSPAAQQFKMLFDSKPVGELGHGHLDFYLPADFTGTFREKMPFVLLVDMAIHHLDLIRFITGRNICRVLAHSFNPSWSWYARDAGLKMLLELEGGIPFTYSGDWTGRGRPSSWSGDWRLQCADGSITFAQNRLSIQRCERWGKNSINEDIAPSTVEMNGQAELLRRFAQAIRTAQPGETSGTDNLWSFAAVMAGVRSAEQEKYIEVADLLAFPSLPHTRERGPG